MEPTTKKRSQLLSEVKNKNHLHKAEQAGFSTFFKISIMLFTLWVRMKLSSEEKLVRI